MSETQPEGVVRDNPGHSRFELVEQGAMAVAEYRRRDGRLIITHVESPDALKGKGSAGRLMTGVLQAARDEGLKVIPICSYAAAFIQRNAQYQDLLA